MCQTIPQGQAVSVTSPRLTKTVTADVSSCVSVLLLVFAHTDFRGDAEYSRDVTCCVQIQFITSTFIRENSYSASLLTELTPEDSTNE